MADLTIDNLHVGFASREGMVRAVDGIDLSIKPGQVVGLVGESGSGKSVTCNSILQLLPSPPARFGPGRIDWSGKDLLSQKERTMQQIRGKEISMIFQDPMSSLNPYLPVVDQVAEPLIIHKICSPDVAKEKALEMLGKVGVAHVQKFPRSYPHEFSGGMRQRAMIAMALITQPNLLLADEPTTALDVTVQAKVLAIIKKLCIDLQVGVLFVSHDLGLVAELADRVVVMYRGKVVEENETKSIFRNPQHPYVKALIACRPTLESPKDYLPTVEDFMGEKQTPLPPLPSESIQARPVSSTPLIQTRQLVVEFQTDDAPLLAVDHVDISIEQGTTLGLVGESGSGKTTLGRTLLNLVKKSQGEVFFKGKAIDSASFAKTNALRKSMQIIFQDPYASLNPRLTIQQALIEPMVVHKICDSKKDRLEKVVSLLQEVGLGEEHLHRYPHEFSGGQRQRICVARALTTEPELIICDECVSAMDVSVQAQVLNLLKSLQASRGLTYLFISHDLSVVKFMSEHIAVMQNGRVIENGSADQIYNHPQMEYTRKLIEAIPKANRSLHLSF